jgi:hypothetical protein
MMPPRFDRLDGLDIDKVHGEVMKPTAAAKHTVEGLARIQSALREVLAARHALEPVLEHQAVNRTILQFLDGIGVDLTEQIIRIRLLALTELALEPGHGECGLCVEAHGERRGAR